MANYTVTLAVHANESFGPAASGRFDFTLLFEDIFLSLVPSILLLTSTVWRVTHLNKQPLKVKNSPLYEGKLVSELSQTNLRHAIDYHRWCLTSFSDHD